MTVTIRGWKDGKLIYERGPIDLADRECELAIADAAVEDAQAMMAGRIGMLEIIFSDGHHVRFGVDPRGMIMPIPMRVETTPK